MNRSVMQTALEHSCVFARKFKLNRDNHESEADYKLALIRFYTQWIQTVLKVNDSHNIKLLVQKYANHLNN